MSVPDGDRKIEDLRVGDYVVTPFGSKLVTATMSREVEKTIRVVTTKGELICTPDHPFILERGVVRADALRYNDVLLGIHTSEVSQWAERQSTGFRNSTASYTTESGKATIWRALKPMGASDICTATFGSFITARFREASRFITKITTSPKMTSQIWNWPNNQRTLHITGGSAQATILLRPKRTLTNTGTWQRNGTDQRMASNGILSTESERGKGARKNRTNARIVVGCMRRSQVRANADSVPLRARARLEGILELITKIATAQYVQKDSSSTDIQRKKHAPMVVGVQKCHDLKRRVYDITVEDAHCFYAEGVLVGNCHDALQYTATILFGEALTATKEKSDFFRKIEYDNRGIR